MVLLSGAFFGFIAMLVNGIGNALSQVPVRKLGLTRMILYRNIATSAFLGVVMLLFSSRVFSFVPVALTVLLGVLGYYGLKLFYYALKVGKVGIVIPVANSSVLVTILLSVIFFSELLSLLQFLSIGFILAGAVLISVDFRSFRSSALFSSSSGFLLACGVVAIWGVFFFLLPLSVAALDPFITAFTIETVLWICALFELLFAKKRLSLPTKKSVILPAVIGVLAGIGTLAFSVGTTFGAVSVVVAITFASPLVSALFAAIFFKERLSLQQWFAIFALVFGIIGVSL